MTLLAGFLDVLLRGVGLLALCASVGGVVYALVVLRALAPAADTAALRGLLGLVALGALALGVSRALVLFVLHPWVLADAGGRWPVADFLATDFGQASLVGTVLALGLAAVAARQRRRPQDRAGWIGATVLALLVLANSAWLAHAVSRLEGRGPLMLATVLHQAGAVLWMGGLMHLVRSWRAPLAPDALGRFSILAMAGVGLVLAPGAALALGYVGDWGALIGTGYGVMVLTKVALMASALVLGGLNYLLVRRWAGAPAARLRAGAHAGLHRGGGGDRHHHPLRGGLAHLAAARGGRGGGPRQPRGGGGALRAEAAAPRPRRPFSSSSLPPRPSTTPCPRASPRSTRGRSTTTTWRVSSSSPWASSPCSTGRDGPAGRGTGRLSCSGSPPSCSSATTPGRGRSGPAGFWESMALPDVLQHRLVVLLVIGLGLFEWLVRIGALARPGWRLVFPILCAVGGGLLLTHSHAMFNLKGEFLAEVSHAPMGILAVFMGWGRWLELRLPDGDRALPGWVWSVALLVIGGILLVYRET